MKNLFLTCCMALSFAYASAQTTPAKTKSTTKTDSTYNKKSKHGAEHNSGNKKGDTINRQRTEKKKGTSTNKTETYPQRRDTVTGTPRP